MACLRMAPSHDVDARRIIQSESGIQREHPLVYASNHMFVDLDEGRFLVDTGSPITIARAGQVTFGERSRPVPRSAGPLDLERLESELGFRCDGLLGTDFLGRCTTCWDGPRGVFVVGAEEPAEAKEPAEPAEEDEPAEAASKSSPGDHAPQGSSLARIRYRSLFGTPVVDARIGGSGGRGGKIVPCIFDTGAQYGYITDPTLADGAQVDGSFDDFSPIIGGIRSDAWRIPVAIEGVRFDERFGILDGDASRRLGLTGFDAIFGCSWLPSRRLWFMPSRSEIAVA